MGTSSSDLARALELDHAVLLGCATTVTRRPFGLVVVTADLPDIHDHNVVLVPPGLGTPPDRLLAAVDGALAGVGAAHRKVLFDDIEDLDRCRRVFEEAGYTSFGYVMMAHDLVTRPPAALPEGAEARVLAPVDVERLTRTLTADRAWGQDPRVVDQFVTLAHRTLKVTDGHAVGLEVDGRVVAGARIYGTGPVHQIEEVEVLGSHQGRGLGRALMAAVIEHALADDPELVFLTADADGWQQGWYERLGFSAFGAVGGFSRG